MVVIEKGCKARNELEEEKKLGGDAKKRKMSTKCISKTLEITF